MNSDIVKTLVYRSFFHVRHSSVDKMGLFVDKGHCSLACRKRQTLTMRYQKPLIDSLE
jgi:hypothetical protein